MARHGWNVPQTVGSAKVLEQPRNVLCHSLTLGLRKLPGSGQMGRGCEMIFQHIRLYAPNCCNHRTRLVDHVEARSFVPDHLLEPADLAFNPAQSRQLSAMVRQRVGRTCSRSAAHILQTAAFSIWLHLSRERDVRFDSSNTSTQL